MHSQKRDTNKHFSVHTYYDISKNTLLLHTWKHEKYIVIILYCDENKNGTMHYFI